VVFKVRARTEAELADYKAGALGWRSWIPYGNEGRARRNGQGQCGRLRHGADAPHYARAG